MTLEGMFLGWCSCYRVRTFFASCTFLYNYLKELPMFLWQIPWRSSNCFWDISPLGLDLFAWIWKLMNLWGGSSQHYPAVLQTTYWIFKLLWWVHSFLLPTNSGGMMKVGLLVLFYMPGDAGDGNFLLPLSLSSFALLLS